MFRGCLEGGETHTFSREILYNPWQRMGMLLMRMTWLMMLPMALPMACPSVRKRKLREGKDCDGTQRDEGEDQEEEEEEGDDKVLKRSRGMHLLLHPHHLLRHGTMQMNGSRRFVGTL